MTARIIISAALATLLLFAPSEQARSAGNLVFCNGYAAFDYGASLPDHPAEPVTMEAHARASNAGSSAPAGLVIRVEYPRPLLALTAEAAYGTLVLDLPADVMGVVAGSLAAEDGFFKALYYEVAAEDNALLFRTDAWDGELTWLHPPDPEDGYLRVTARLRMVDWGPDGAADTADDRVRDLTGVTIRLFRTLEPVSLPEGEDIYIPDDEIYVGGEVVTYYDDGCNDDPTLDDYDEYYDEDDSYYYGEDDSGCDGDTWDDDDRDSGDDSSCDDDWDDSDDSDDWDDSDWDSDSDDSDWEGDDWASAPRRLDGRILGAALPGLVRRAILVNRRALRVCLPLALGLLFVLGLKGITRRRSDVHRVVVASRKTDRAR